MAERGVTVEAETVAGGKAEKVKVVAEAVTVVEVVRGMRHQGWC